MKSIAAELLAHGIPSEAIIEFGAKPKPREVRYLDLFKLDGDTAPGVLPTGVIESSTRPAVYFKASGGMGSAALSHTELQDLIRTLACRADARYLALVSPGVVTVYKIGFFDTPDEIVPIFETNTSAFRLRNLISGLDLPSLDSADNSDKQWLEGHLFSLLKGAASAIRSAAKNDLLSNEDVISLIGRALFTRFLVDRDILKSSELGNVVPGAYDATGLFDTPKAASSTFKWLDEIFNGDLLHLSNTDYRSFFDALGDKSAQVCLTLGNIMRRAPGGQLSLDWGGLRFKHIPVDMLSQVYEHFAHENFPDLAQKTSIHYTPRAIAELVVDGAFTALPAEKVADATVLDPAAGAGIFLVLAFRRLVGELWFRQDSRPNRKQIRKILNTQLCGMDINPESLKIAALSLYLAALELDPDPQPLTDLKFDELFDTVLHCVEESRLQGKDAHLGSLAIGTPNIGQFDVVVGNPPWTELSIKEKPYLDALATTAIELLQTSNFEKKVGANSIPKQAPDLAFLWKSINWCKPNGVIGYVLHARLLFSTEHFDARRLLFSNLRITGLINASALRQLPKVWPSNAAPFCAVVAKNAKPRPDDTFYYLNPHAELNSKVNGEIRLDASAALPVTNQLVADCPFALKTLFKGSALDLNLVMRIAQKPRIPFDEYTQISLGKKIRQGYMVAAKNKSAENISDLSSLETKDHPKFEVDTAQLETVRTRYPTLEMEWPRPRTIYQGPLLLFRQAPKFNREMRGAIWSKHDVAFCFSYYGIPVGESPIGEYLFVLSYSDLFVYWSLLTSAKFGIERPTFYLEDIRSFPVAPYDLLSELQREQSKALASQIKKGQCPWIELENFVKEVYKISHLDWQLITDALTYSSPYPQSIKRAATSIANSGIEISEFIKEMQISLNMLVDDALTVRTVAVPVLSNWLFFEASKVGAVSLSRETSQDLSILAKQIAGEPSFWTTQLRLQIAPGHWLVGQPNQARYWSISKARLLALQLSESEAFSSSFIG